MESLLDVDFLFHRRPELFPQPVPTMEKRRTVFLGELVKIAIGIRQNESLVSGRWLIVESISDTESGPRAVGRSWQPFYADDSRYPFGPENIYRMEPRRFFLWGASGVPVALRSGDGSDDQIPVRPVDSKERLIDECDTVILEFCALGNLAAKAFYCELVRQHAHWPTLANLK